MKRKTFMAGLTLILLSMLIPFSASAETSASFTLSISNETPQVGQEITVSVQGHNLKDLYAYEVNLAYNSEQLQFKQAMSDIDGMSTTPIVKDGNIQFANTKIGNKTGENGDAALCKFTFDIIGKGTIKVELNDVKLVSSQLTVTSLKANAQLTAPLKGGNSKAFTDINGHWAKEAIEKAAATGFVNGFEDNSFRPNGLVTRGEFAAMLTRALGLPSGDAELDFEDADQIPQWAKPGIASTVAAGIVKGYEDHTVRADEQITRAEMAAFVVRALKLEVTSADVVAFSDASKIPDWAAPYVTAAYKKGLFKGRSGNMFAPNENATRAEAVTVILAVIQK